MGGLGVQWTWTQAALGAAAWPALKAPKGIKASRRAPGAHPRLSLSEATRLHPRLASSVPPPGLRAGRIFPS